MRLSCTGCVQRTSPCRKLLPYWWPGPASTHRWQTEWTLMSIFYLCDAASMNWGVIQSLIRRDGLISLTGLSQSVSHSYRLLMSQQVFAVKENLILCLNRLWHAWMNAHWFPLSLLAAQGLSITVRDVILGQQVSGRLAEHRGTTNHAGTYMIQYNNCRCHRDRPSL